MYNRFAERRRRLLNECRGGIYTGMLLAGTQEPHFYKERLGILPKSPRVRTAAVLANPPNLNIRRS